MGHRGPPLREGNLLVADGAGRGPDKLFARAIGPGWPPALSAQSLRSKFGRLGVVLSLGAGGIRF
jgi:hypothetical protein